MTDKIISRKLGTKAETLASLSTLGYSIPKIYYFTVNDWKLSRTEILDKIKKLFNKNIKVAVRSSSLIEDTASSSMAGAFQSFSELSRAFQRVPELFRAFQSFSLSSERCPWDVFWTFWLPTSRPTGSISPRGPPSPPPSRPSP